MRYLLCLIISLVPSLAYAQTSEIYFQDYAANGIPTLHETKEIDALLLTQIAEALPERSQVSSDFLKAEYDPNLYIHADAELFVTFMDEGAGYKNALGYVNYTDDAFNGLTKQDIDSNNNGFISLNELTTLDGVTVGSIFPNVSKVGGGGSLVAGDTIQLGGANALFDAGSKVGFFLGANSWQWNGIAGFDQSGNDITRSDGFDRFFYSMDFLNPEANSNATYGYNSQADNSRHVAMLYASEQNRNDIVLGFEDLIRPGGDNDFNDAVFTITATPAAALGEQEIFTAPSPVMGQWLGLCMLLSFLTLQRGIRQ